MQAPAPPSGVRAQSLARAVVSDRHLAGEVVERGDDEDAARRSRHDARPRTCAAFAAAERLRVTVDADGAVIAREREKGFRKWGVFGAHQNGSRRAWRGPYSLGQ